MKYAEHQRWQIWQALERADLVSADTAAAASTESGGFASGVGEWRTSDGFSRNDVFLFFKDGRPEPPRNLRRVDLSSTPFAGTLGREEYEPFSKSVNRAINGVPRDWKESTDEMRDLASQRSSVPKTFSCGCCGARVAVARVLEHVCQPRTEAVVTSAEQCALIAQITELEARFAATLARIERTLVELAARFPADERVLSTVEEFIADALGYGACDLRMAA